MKKVIAFVVALALATPAFAMNDRLEGVLIGIGTAIAVDKVFRNRGGTPPWSTQRGFPPFRCTGDEIQCAYERGVYERMRQEYEEEKRKAYECGYYGNC